MLLHRAEKDMAAILDYLRTLRSELAANWDVPTDPKLARKRAEILDGISERRGVFGSKNPIEMAVTARCLITKNFEPLSDMTLRGQQFWFRAPEMSLQLGDNLDVEVQTIITYETPNNKYVGRSKKS